MKTTKEWLKETYYDKGITPNIEDAMNGYLKYIQQSAPTKERIIEVLKEHIRIDNGGIEYLEINKVRYDKAFLKPNAINAIASELEGEEKNKKPLEVVFTSGKKEVKNLIDGAKAMRDGLIKKG